MTRLAVAARQACEEASGWRPGERRKEGVLSSIFTEDTLVKSVMGGGGSLLQEEAMAVVAGNQ